MADRNLHTLFLVDDDRSTTFFNKWLIGKMGWDCALHTFKNGQEALDAIQSGTTPELILLDINMPVMNGFQFLEAYRALGGDQALVALMLTNQLLGPQQEQVAKFGVEYMIHKPLTEEKLQDLHSKYFS